MKTRAKKKILFLFYWNGLRCRCSCCCYCAPPNISCLSCANFGQSCTARTVTAIKWMLCAVETLHSVYYYGCALTVDRATETTAFCIPVVNRSSIQCLCQWSTEWMRRIRKQCLMQKSSGRVADARQTVNEWMERQHKHLFDSRIATLFTWYAWNFASQMKEKKKNVNSTNTTMLAGFYNGWRNTQ